MVPMGFPGAPSAPKKVDEVKASNTFPGAPSASKKVDEVKTSNTFPGAPSAPKKVDDVKASSTAFSRYNAAFGTAKASSEETPPSSSAANVIKAYSAGSTSSHNSTPTRSSHPTTAATAATPPASKDPHMISKDEKIARLIDYYREHQSWPSFTYRDPETGAALGAFLDLAIVRQVRLTREQRAALQEVDSNVFKTKRDIARVTESSRRTKQMKNEKSAKTSKSKADAKKDKHQRTLLNLGRDAYDVIVMIRNAFRSPQRA